VASRPASGGRRLLAQLLEYSRHQVFVDLIARHEHILFEFNRLLTVSIRPASGGRRLVAQLLEYGHHQKFADLISKHERPLCEFNRVRTVRTRPATGGHERQYSIASAAKKSASTRACGPQTIKLSVGRLIRSRDPGERYPATGGHTPIWRADKAGMTNESDSNDAYCAALLELAESRFSRWHLKELRPERDRRTKELEHQHINLSSAGRAVFYQRLEGELLEKESRQRIAMYAGVAREKGNSRCCRSTVSMSFATVRLCPRSGHPSHHFGVACSGWQAPRGHPHH
jgi:hypothetical protein